jgi:Sigma-70, region 4
MTKTEKLARAQRARVADAEGVAQRRREFVRCLYKQGYNFRQIGERLGVTPARARQIVAKAERIAAEQNARWEVNLQDVALQLSLGRLRRSPAPSARRVL